MKHSQPSDSDYPDCNLLFAVLALQADFIDQRQFVDVCGAWGVHTDAAFADLLLERQWITEDNRRLIEQLLERKLEKHGGDARESLGGLGDPQAKKALAEAASKYPFIQEIMASAGPSGSGSGPAEEEEDPRSRYEFLEAQPLLGGMGQVWHVRDKILGRELALKEPRNYLNPGAKDYFFQEAAAHARLTHPNIVPLFDFSRPPGASPFYTMLWVKGQTLSQAVEAYHTSRRQGQETPLALRKLLGKFIAVCQAVGYAHEKKLLHRDLKGANVVLGEHGEVFLLDWGLAKDLGGTEEARNVPTMAEGLGTRRGDKKGTPPYMAPEQAAGELHRLNERTDIFGLGAILYEILTDQPPYPLVYPPGADEEVKRQKLDELFAQIQQEDPLRPREFNPQVPAALEAVCLKALSRDQDKRYAAAQDLAREVDNWLAGEPVAAYQDPWIVKSSRWAKKHKSLVAAVASLLLAAIPLLAPLSLTTERAREDLENEQANTLMAFKKLEEEQGKTWMALKKLEKEQKRTKEALGLAEKSEALAKQKEREAKSASKLAVEQRNLALQTIKTVTNDIHQEMRYKPGLEKLRKKLLETALEGLKKVARSVDNEEAIAIENFMVFSQLGELLLTYGKGKAAAQYIEKAHYQLVETTKRFRGELAYKFLLADSYVVLASSSRAKFNQTASAESYLEEGRKIAEAVVREHSSDETNSLLAKILGELGEENISMERWDKARDYLERAQPIWQILVDKHPANVFYFKQLINCYDRLGNVYLNLEDPQAAKNYLEKNLIMVKNLPIQTQDNFASQLELAALYERLGDFFLKVGVEKTLNTNLFPDALDWFNKCLKIREKLILSEPENNYVKIELARIYGKMAEGKYAQKDRAGYMEYFDKWRKTLEEIVKEDPVNVLGLLNSYSYCNKAGIINQDRGYLSNAKKYYENGLQFLDLLNKINPGPYDRDLSLTYMRLVHVSWQLGQFSAAKDYLGKSLRNAENLVRKEPKNIKMQIELINIYSLFALFYLEEGDTEVWRWLAKTAEKHQELIKEGKIKVTNSANNTYMQVIKEIGETEESIKNPEIIRKKTVDRQRKLLAVVTRYFHKQKKTKEALVVANQLAELEPGNWRTLFQAACGFSLILGNLPKEDEQQEKIALRGIELLQLAITKGFSNLDLLKHHDHLEALRSRPDFQALVKKLEAESPP